MSPCAVYCADVGSIKAGRFGWAGRSPAGADRDGTSIEELAARVASELRDGPVALGLEAPLFVPARQEPTELTAGRNGEGSRAWSAGAGCGALATGLVEAVWLLSRIHEAVTPPPPLFFDWATFQAAGRGLFLWEAFVTGDAKKGSHVGDAKAGLDAFVAAMDDPPSYSLIDESRVFSLVAAAALRAGWEEAAELIDRPCLVVGPSARAGLSGEDRHQKLKLQRVHGAQRTSVRVPDAGGEGRP